MLESRRDQLRQLAEAVRLDPGTQRQLSAIQRRMGPLLSEVAPPLNGTVHQWLEWFMGEVDVGQLYAPGRASFEPTTEKALTAKSRKKLADKATAQSKSGVKVPQHYVKECSMKAFQQNVRYFYKVKGSEWEGSKKEKLQRAIAASYSSLKRACGVESKERMTPKEIVAAGGGS